MKRLLAAGLVLLPLLSRADEGMWTYDAFPREKLEKAHGFKPTDAWLEKARLSSARLARGCSASFVSDQGLVATNHHCAHDCVQGLSTAQKDHVAEGFYAKTQAEEPRCPDVEVNQLVQISDVTPRVRKATANLEGKDYLQALRAEMATIEKECQTSPDLRCEVVSLYHGGVYDLYRYRRYQDVRLVFAPEFRIAFFGGDPDNFMFPRYDLDVAFLRVYENGRPVRTKDHFTWSAKAPEQGELTFVSGHPGGTSRALTVAQLEYQRDVSMPETLIRYSELRGLLTAFGERGPEEKRISTELLFAYENGLKARRGRWDALRDAKFFASLVAGEQALKAALARSPENAAKYLPAFDAIARAEDRYRQIRKVHAYLEYGAGFQGELFHHARHLLRGAEERQKPNEKRLREYRESAIPELTQALFSPAPIYPQLEKLLLGFSLTKLREVLGPDDPAVKRLLGARSPQEVADAAVAGSKLFDPAVRKQLWEGGAKAVAASDDPVIAIARLVDPDARAVRKVFEDEVESVVQKNSERIAEARFATEGRSTYPDATFTLRLNYGQVKGWTRADGVSVEPFTRFAGVWERATGRDPFKLPDSWLAAKDRLDPATPFDFATTNDIIGGNSGSPVFDRDLRVVGLIFDGNIESLGGDYGFDESANRAVAVSAVAITEALDKVYGARRIVDELRGAGAPSATPAAASAVTPKKK
ncbi:MAG TPA: S46 family peptidase [Anaeromyxobacteraceae bacterium]|nr:S46 family peptidase [Anaeromyxobacteraceae bacterium]